MNPRREFREMSKMSTAIISDAMSRIGLKHRTMHSGIKPLSPEMVMAGTAVTAECYPGGTHATGEIIKLLKPGNIAVMEGRGYSEAVLWGEICTLMAMVNGAGGAVIDGAVRDVPEIIKLGFPMFARHVSPACGTGDKLGRTNVPVSCAGVVVEPGDYVFGDELGVVVVPANILPQTYETCREVMRKEEEMINSLRAKLAKKRNLQGRRDDKKV